MTQLSIVCFVLALCAHCCLCLNSTSLIHSTNFIAIIHSQWKWALRGNVTSFHTWTFMLSVILISNSSQSIWMHGYLFRYHFKSYIFRIQRFETWPKILNSIWTVQSFKHIFNVYLVVALFLELSHTCSEEIGSRHHDNGLEAGMMLRSSPPGKFVLTSWQIVITTSGALLRRQVTLVGTRWRFNFST